MLIFVSNIGFFAYCILLILSAPNKWHNLVHLDEAKRKNKPADYSSVGSSFAPGM